jgi:tetratricopeptide (TPR) repeat protein
MASGELEDAVIAFRESVALYPHFKCLELWGECLLKLDRPLEAIVPLAAAARLNRQVRAAALLALAFLRVGEAERAAEIAEEVCAQAPGNRVARQVLADPAVVRALAARRERGDG